MLLTIFHLIALTTDKLLFGFFSASPSGLRVNAVSTQVKKCDLGEHRGNVYRRSEQASFKEVMWDTLKPSRKNGELLQPPVRGMHERASEGGGRGVRLLSRTRP